MARSIKTTLKEVKKCKSCVRFNAVDDKVTIAFYLMNEGYNALGKPQKIQVEVTAAEKSGKSGKSSKSKSKSASSEGDSGQ